MFMTATPVAATEPRVNLCASLPAAPLVGEAPDEAGRIGSILAGLVPDGNVRAMEALAAVIVRSDWGQICAAAALQGEALSGGDAMKKTAAAGERIARRALAKTLEDASRGANRFHRVGDFPDWARESRPAAQVGDFLFYQF